MRDFASYVADGLATIPSITSKTAEFVGRDGFKARVNIGGSTVSLPFAGMYLPPPAHPVQLELRDDTLTVTGPARPLPGIGIVKATGSPRATVTAWGVDYLLPFRAGYTPTLNDQVDISWSVDGGLIQGKVSTTSNITPPVENGPPTSQVFHPAPFLAVDSGSYRGGWWTNDVYSSDNNDGAWFYGDLVRGTIPDNARIRAASIFLPARQTSGDPPNLQLHTSAGKPGGSVTFTGGVIPLSDARAGWVRIPTSVIDFLKVNPGGLGFNNGGYQIYRGRGSDEYSGALDIEWEA